MVSRRIWAACPTLVMAEDSRSWGSSRIMAAKPWPASPSRLLSGTRTSVKYNSAVSASSCPALSSLRPRWKPGMPSSTTNKVMPLAPPAGSVRAATMTRSAW